MTLVADLAAVVAVVAVVLLEVGAVMVWTCVVLEDYRDGRE